MSVASMPLHVAALSERGFGCVADAAATRSQSSSGVSASAACWARRSSITDHVRWALDLVNGQGRTTMQYGRQRTKLEHCVLRVVAYCPV